MPGKPFQTRGLAPRHAFRVRGSSIGFRKRTKNRVLVLERSKFIFFLILFYLFFDPGLRNFFFDPFLFFF